MALVLTHFFLRRGANFPNTVRSQTVPSAPSLAIPPGPATMCMLKRLVKLFSQLLVRKWFQTAIAWIQKLLPCKMKMWNSCWSLVQVSWNNTKTCTKFFFFLAAPKCLSPNCRLRVQVHARTCLCSLNLMNPRCQRRCSVCPSMRRTFTDTWGRARCEIIWPMSTESFLSCYCVRSAWITCGHELLLLISLPIPRDNCFCPYCQVNFKPKTGYLEKHPEIASGMRVILVDWLVEVVQEYKLRSETLHLAVNYLDRFLSCTTNVKRGKLQLVGTAALLIAS